MYQKKIYTFELVMKEDLNSLKELEANLESLGIKFIRNGKFYLHNWTKRARLFKDASQEIFDKVQSLPWYLPVEEMEQSLLDWSSRLVNLRVDCSELGGEDFKELDDYIKYFIKVNFKGFQFEKFFNY